MNGSWSGPALAHSGSGAQAWENLALVVSLALLGAGYGRGVHELWARRGTGAVVAGWRVAAFALGAVALLAAQTDPVHRLADSSLAGHMFQHMLLLLVAGPLLAAGAPGLPLALAGPRRARRWWARRRAGGLGLRLRRPGSVALLAGTVHGVVLWAWHLPALFQLALASPVTHTIEHASFVAAAVLLWSTILGAEQRRLPGPVVVLLLFATMLPASALGAALTLAPFPIYAAPSSGDPLTDQQLAGLLMWIPMDAVVLVAALVVLLRWLTRQERISPTAAEPRQIDASRR
jgi:cytochrome c oxidase assembly factor CtaG